MENIIVTYNGEKAPKSSCRFIKGEFYIKNKQCFNINGIWYRINSGLIAKDHEMGDYKIIKGSSLIHGVIGYDRDNQEFLTGYFTPNKYKNVRVFAAGTLHTAISESILDKDFVINLHDLTYYKIGSAGIKKTVNTNFCLANNFYKSLPYNVRNIGEEEMTTIEKYAMAELSKHVPGEKICLSSSRYLPSFTYGIEFETSAGAVPEHHLSKGGLIPLRDGSIRGFEYATIPYSSSDIGTAVSLACKTLNTYTTMSIHESLHVHIGNIRHKTEEFIGILYTLCCVLEKEMYSMFPKYYAETSKFKNRGKDYNKPLAKALVDANPKTTFNNIATYLSAGRKYGGFGSQHPSDPDGQHKWQIETRYHWVNFINLLFGNSGTIEFRIHTPSKNPYKIMNWLYIISAIVSYAQYIHANKDTYTMLDIKKVTLKQILSKIYNVKLANHLIEYVEYRKDQRIISDAANDFCGEREVNGDMAFLSDFHG